jgi:hypothetical protein
LGPRKLPLSGVQAAYRLLVVVTVRVEVVDTVVGTITMLLAVVLTITIVEKDDVIETSYK